MEERDALRFLAEVDVGASGDVAAHEGGVREAAVWCEEVFVEGVDAGDAEVERVVFVRRAAEDLGGHFAERAGAVGDPAAVFVAVFEEDEGVEREAAGVGGFHGGDGGVEFDGAGGPEVDGVGAAGGVEGAGDGGGGGRGGIGDDD